MSETEAIKQFTNNAVINQLHKKEPHDQDDNPKRRTEHRYITAYKFSSQGSRQKNRNSYLYLKKLFGSNFVTKRQLLFKY